MTKKVKPDWLSKYYKAHTDAATLYEKATIYDAFPVHTTMSTTFGPWVTTTATGTGGFTPFVTTTYPGPTWRVIPSEVRRIMGETIIELAAQSRVAVAAVDALDD